MDNWDPSVVYQLATQRYREDIARGAAAQRRAALCGRRAARARLAGALVALAARLDPAATRPDPRGAARCRAAPP